MVSTCADYPQLRELGGPPVTETFIKPLTPNNYVVDTPRALFANASKERLVAAAGATPESGTSLQSAGVILVTQQPNTSELLADRTHSQPAQDPACSCGQEVVSRGDRFISFGNGCPKGGAFSLIPTSRYGPANGTFFIKLSSGKYLSYTGNCNKLHIDSWPRTGINQAFTFSAVDERADGSSSGCSLEAVGRAKCPNRFLSFDQNCTAGRTNWLAKMCVLTSAIAEPIVSCGEHTAAAESIASVLPVVAVFGGSISAGDGVKHLDRY